jgi:hypothetical protein
VARKRAKGRTGGSKGHKKYKVSGEQEQEQVRGSQEPVIAHPIHIGNEQKNMKLLVRVF